MRGPNVGKDRIDIITMQALGNRPVLDTTRFINIADYVQKKYPVNNQITTPVQLADLLNKNAEKILNDLTRYRHKKPNSGLEIELTDLEVLAYLQKFFAQRIQATLLLANHILLQKELEEDKIKEHLDASITCWEKIIEQKERFNKRDIPYIFKENLDYHEYLKTLKEERNTFQNIDEFWIHDVR